MWSKFGLAAQAQTVLEQDTFSGHVFCFRARRHDLVKPLSDRMRN
jgi:transposase